MKVSWWHVALYTVFCALFQSWLDDIRFAQTVLHGLGLK